MLVAYYGGLIANKTALEKVKLNGSETGHSKVYAHTPVLYKTPCFHMRQGSLDSRPNFRFYIGPSEN